MKKIIVLILLTLFPLGGFSDFAPWQNNLKTGDETLNVEQKKGSSRGKSVLNGFQGGAYFLIRFFQTVISPQDGPNCRHDPVCSVYAREAVEKHGAFIGSILAGDRLLRCNPFYYIDKDPVPSGVLEK